MRLALLSTLLAAPALADDWPMWGGRPDRNVVSAAKNLPSDWDLDKGRGVKWVAELSDLATYGSPVVAGGRVFIGTTNIEGPRMTPRDPSVKGDKGILACFSEKDGSFLWQAVHDKLPGGNDVDYEHAGVCSTPCVAGDRVYYVSNRGELICADAAGFSDGENDGPFKGESRAGPRDADFVWVLDMIGELGVEPYQASASSPLVVGDRVFVVTGNGAGVKTHKVKDPKAPSFIAVDRATGKVAWQDSSPGERILEGQWGSPSYAVVEGTPQVAFPGGDGWLYAFEPDTGKLLWKFNCRAHETVAPEPEKQWTMNQLVAMPVYAGHRVLIGLGQKPENGSHPGCVRAIDARGRGDVTKTHEVWRFGGKDFESTMSNMTVHEGLVYAAEVRGILTCLDVETGKPVWQHDLFSEIWGTPLVADGKVWVMAGGEVLLFAAGREKKLLAVHKSKALTSSSTITVANGIVYLPSQAKLWAVGK